MINIDTCLALGDFARFITIKPVSSIYRALFSCFSS